MASTVYTAHRENQREWILEVAEDLFIQKGIEQVTMGDIADASHITRATVYKYFANKEEMAAEIFKSVTRGWVERDEREVWSFQGNGYELIERFVNSHFNYLFQNRREASFVAEFNYLYAKEWSTETAMKLFSENLEGERQKLLDAVRQGQAEGSLRADVDAELVLATIFNFNSGMMSRLGELGDKVENEFGIGAQTIFMQICQFFLDGIKTHSTR
jgi:AcrR family transcriptional regulator